MALSFLVRVCLLATLCLPLTLLACSDDEAGGGGPARDVGDAGDASGDSSGDVGDGGDTADDIIVRPDGADDVTGNNDNNDPGGECDVVAQDCPNDAQCDPLAGVPTCNDPNPFQHQEDEECEGGDCAPGTTCVNWGGERGQVCTRVCNRETLEGCSEGTFCSSWLRSNMAIGLCDPAPVLCDIYAQDCDEGQACTLGRDPENNDAIFVCEAAGEQGPNDECGGGAGRCMAGYICIRLTNEDSRCREVCQETDDECTDGTQTCSGASSEWDVRFCR